MELDFLKTALGDELYQQVAEKLNGSNIKLADLSTGDYVSTAKMNTKIQAEKDKVTALQEQITKRDTDLKDLQTQLEAAKGDAEKYTALQTSMNDLQKHYNDDKAAYEEKLKKQDYEFKVRERGNGIKFTSNAAKESFMRAAIAKNFAVENDKLMGFDDYLSEYKTNDPGAFVVEKQDDPKPPKPNFVKPTDPKPNMTDVNPFHFNFQQVRQKPEN